MSETQRKITKAHQLVARSAGTLALGLGANRIGRKALGMVALDLEEAAKLVTEVRNG